MEKSDHITLTLAGAGLPTNSGLQGLTTTTTTTTRKSLRRSWNQLPRLQRNLIIVGILCLCVVFFLFIPGDQIISDKVVSSGPSPYHAGRELARGIDHQGLPVDSGDDSNVLSSDESKDKEQTNKESQVAELVPPPAHQKQQQSLVAEDNSLAHSKLFPALEERPLNQVNIEEFNVNNNLESANEADEGVGGYPAAPAGQEMDVRSTIEALISNAKLVPGKHAETIDEFVDSISGDATLMARKRHFHGASNERQIAVVEAFRHSWRGYKKYAWGQDNLKPISQTSYNWFGLGLTIVDSLDTMYIMGLEDEFTQARDWIKHNLNLEVSRDVNLFEVTIRVLGGLMSAYHLSGDTIFLKKSMELGNRLLPSFLTPSGIPFSDVNLATMYAHSPKWSPDSSTSEVTTIQLEFRDLSRATGVPIYEKVVDIVNQKVHALEKNNGLVPIFINANTGSFRNYATISLGARGDSYYEYLLKQWLQTGRKANDDVILDYMKAIDGVLTKLMRRTPREHHVYIGELINGREFKPKMDHLTCYLPGTLLLGHTHGMPDSHLVLASDLLETCYQMYMKQATQLAPEICYFALNNSEEQDIYVKPSDTHNLQRPEFIESLYYFYALTGNRTYQDMGWTIFQAFEKHTKVNSGYTSIGNVKNIFNTRLKDMMETFWLGETLKYFYLLFSDDRKEIDLDKWVFNSEAHLLPIRNN